MYNRHHKLVDNSSKFILNMKVRLDSAFYCKEFFGNEDTDCLNHIGSLRFQVWKDEGLTIKQLKILGEDNKWLDSCDIKSYHWAIFDKSSDKLVASARLLPCRDFSSLPYDNWYTDLSEIPKGRIGHLGRDVVNTNYRSKGFGTYLNIGREQKAKKLGIESLIADIPSYRKSNFEKLGYKEIQPAKPGTLIPSIDWSVVVKSICSQSDSLEKLRVA